jgi:hypothetical protein
VVLSPSEKSDTVCKNNLDSLNRRVYTYHIDSAAVARGARTEEGKMDTTTTGITRGQRARGEKPVLNDEALYLTDNGRCLCGKHCGNSKTCHG